MNTQTIETTEHQGQIASIVELVDAYNKAQNDGDSGELIDAEQFIRDDALEIAVRSGWESSINEDTTAAEFMILLATGGPAYRLIGTLEEGMVESVRLEHQDWGTPWIDVWLSKEEREACMTYASVFYFGDN